MAIVRNALTKVFNYFKPLKSKMLVTDARNCIKKVKHYWLLISVVSVLTSCQNKQKSNKEGHAQASEQKVSLKAEFMPVIQGVWVKKDYIDKIALTKSPAAAIGLADGITVLYFDKGKMAGDSLVADIVWNNHEGSTAIVHFKPGKQPHTLLFYEDMGGYSVSSLGYKITGLDTVLIRYHTDQGKTTVINYVKALNGQPHDQMDAGINQLINDRLIAGTYTLSNTKVSESRVIFNKEGRVDGLKNFSTYYIKNDVGGEPMNNLDEIMFNMTSKTRRKDYSYKITGDTLTLFNTYPNGDFTKSMVGKPVYKLIKQR